MDNAAYRLTSPGLGKEVGASLGVIQSFYQGLFQAPTVVSGALKGAIFAANILKNRISGHPKQHRIPPRYHSGSNIWLPGRCDRILSGHSGSSTGGFLCNTGALGYAGL